MNQSTTVNEVFIEIEKKIQSELFSYKDIYDPLAYDSVNFKNRILEPLIQGIFGEIDRLAINEVLTNKIDITIAKVEAFRDNELKPKGNLRMVKCQISHLNYLISEFSSKKIQILNLIENPINDKTDPRLLTKLSRNQTALLILYLQEAGAIKPFQAINDQSMCDAFGTLTGYNGEQLRKLISGSGREKNVITVKKELYNELKEMFLLIIDQIDQDLVSFN